MGLWRSNACSAALHGPRSHHCVAASEPFAALHWMTPHTPQHVCQRIVHMIFLERDFCTDLCCRPAFPRRCADSEPMKLGRCYCGADIRKDGMGSPWLDHAWHDDRLRHHSESAAIWGLWSLGACILGNCLHLHIAVCAVCLPKTLRCGLPREAECLQV